MSLIGHEVKVKSQKSKIKIRGVRLTKLFMVLLVLSPFCAKAHAGAIGKPSIGGEAEYKLSDFERSPKPALTSTGTNLAEDYRLSVETSMFKEGALNSLVGVSFDDKYRKDAIDIENKTRFDYGKWLRAEALKKNETDEEIFFSGAVEPQSPINTTTEKYFGELRLDNISALEYTFENKERKDLVLGTVTGDETETRKLRFRRETGVFNIDGGYKTTDFKDTLGSRSDVTSNDTEVEMSYRPNDMLNVIGEFENSEDKDLDRSTQLHSRSSRAELSLKPLRELKIRNKLRRREDDNTETDENIDNRSYEIITNYDPVKQAGIELAYKFEDENKDRASLNADSTTNEKRAKLRLVTVSGVSFQSGYELSDKASDLDTENLERTKMYSDLSLEPARTVRFGGDVSNTTQKNSITRLTESDTSAVAVNMQYRPNQKIFSFTQAGKTRTENPSTDSFTETNTISSNLNMKTFSFLNTSLRTSGQETRGSSENADARRLLGAVQFDLTLLNNLNLTTEYERINSWGETSQEENLFDASIFYSLNKFDFSTRFQERIVTGDNPSDKATFLGNIKYRLSKNLVIGLRLSVIDYVDKLTDTNSYNSITAEGTLSLKF